MCVRICMCLRACVCVRYVCLSICVRADVDVFRRKCLKLFMPSACVYISNLGVFVKIQIGLAFVSGYNPNGPFAIVR